MTDVSSKICWQAPHNPDLSASRSVKSQQVTMVQSVAPRAFGVCDLGATEFDDTTHCKVSAKRVDVLICPTSPPRHIRGPMRAWHDMVQGGTHEGPGRPIRVPPIMAMGAHEGQG